MELWPAQVPEAGKIPVETAAVGVKMIIMPVKLPTSTREGGNGNNKETFCEPDWVSFSFSTCKKSRTWMAKQLHGNFRAGPLNGALSLALFNANPVTLYRWVVFFPPFTQRRKGLSSSEGWVFCSLSSRAASPALSLCHFHLNPPEGGELLGKKEASLPLQARI